MKTMLIIAVGVALFCAGRRVHRAQPRPADAAHAITAETTRAAASSAQRRAEMQALLTQLAHASAASTPAQVTRSIREPADITAKRRLRATAEIDQRAPGLSTAKRRVLLDEADRLAWDKRQLRAAFVAGTLSEAEYVAALQDDIRAALADFEETLSEDEYVALFNRRPGADPFTLESLVGRPPDERDVP